MDRRPGGWRGGASAAERPYRRPRREDQDDYAPPPKQRGQRPADVYAPAVRHVLTRLAHRRTAYAYHVPPHEYYAKDVVAARETAFNPSTAIGTQWLSTSARPDTQHVPVLGLRWAPSGRRVLCSTRNGEFLLYNGHSFGLEVRTVAHEDEAACRALAWGAATDLIFSASDTGSLKVWRPSLVLAAEAATGHRAVRGISLAPLERKLCTCGEDGTARVWDTQSIGGGAAEESRLEGHGGDVTAVEWHPVHSLIATGSQDTQVRLWDPRAAASGSVSALHGHSQTVSAVRWRPDGLSLLTAGKDNTVRLWDVRQMRPELKRFKAHTGPVSDVAWHPQSRDLFASAGADGRVLYWMAEESGGTNAHGVLETSTEAAAIHNAHDQFRGRAIAVNCLAWSPLGHVLASAGNDIRYWGRGKPGALAERERGGDDDADALARGDGV